MSQIKSLLNLAVFFLLCSNFLLFPQNRKGIFETLDMDEGLSSNRVTCFIQDNDGFLWIGTQDGLNLYNGYTFQQFVASSEQDKPDIIDNHILSLREDEDGQLWIGTANGLTRMNKLGTSSVHYDTDPNDTTTISSHYITSILCTGDGTVWIGSGWGLNRYNKETDSFTRYTRDPLSPDNEDNNRIFDIIEDSNAMLWLATDGGLVRFNPETETSTAFTHDQDDPSSIVSNHVRTLAEDKNNHIWVGTTSGLDRFDPDTHVFTHFRADPADPEKLSHNTINKLYLTDEGHLWIATQWGLNVYDPEDKAFHSYFKDKNDPKSLCGNHITAIYQSRAGVLWIGTQREGISKYVPMKQAFRFYQLEQDNQDIDSNIEALCVDDSTHLWLGTFSGLYYYDLEHETFQCYNGPPVVRNELHGNFVSSIRKDQNNRLWVGTFHQGNIGINCYDPRTRQFTYYHYHEKDSTTLSSNDILFINTDHEGRIWVSTQGYGVNRYNPGSDTFTRYISDYSSENKLGGNWVQHIYCDPAGYLWFATDFGLSRFIYETGKFENFRHHDGQPETLSSSRVTTVYRDTRGVLWVGTENGLNKMTDPSGTFESYNIENGLSSSYITGIVEDKDGDLWLATDNGLTLFDPKSERFRAFDERDGLWIMAFNLNENAKLPSGELVFGGLDGFIRFNPQDLKKQTLPPQVVITDFKKLNTSLYSAKQLVHLDTIELNYNNDFIELEFAVLDFYKPERNRYAFKLEGFDKDWRYSGNRRFVNYTNLAHGKYSFTVRGANSFGVWGSGESINIIVHPPIWATWWFRIFAVCAVLGSVFGVFKWRMDAHERRRQQLEQKVNERTQELQNKTMELVESRERYQRLFDEAPVGYVEIDRSGTVIQANETIEPLLGYQPQETIGQSFLNLLVADDKNRAVRVVTDIIDHNKAGHMEQSLQCKDGHHVQVSLHYNVVYDTVLKKKVLRVALQDLTEIRLLEEQLRQSQKMEAIGRVTGGVAHDFNNILTIIRGYCSLLLMKTKKDEKIHDALKRIDQAGERAEGLTRQLLIFSRKQDLSPRVINLNDTLSEMEHMLLPLLGERIKVDIHYSDQPAFINVDRNQFEHMIMNLAINAKDAMPDGGILSLKIDKVELGEERIGEHFVIPPGWYCTIVVEDTGTGIDEETLEHIFEPFYTTKDKGKGTGLGLSMVYGFIQQSNGYIDVKSKPDQGTEFTLYFPETDSQIVEKEKHVATDAGSSGGETILVVEDEEQVRTLVESMLRENGYIVYSASDADEDLQPFINNSRKLDMIISDVIMPSKSGPEIVEKIRQKYPDIKVIFMSGYSGDFISKENVTSEGINFIKKPFNQFDLLSKVRQVLDS